MDIIFDPQMTIGDMVALERLSRDHRPHVALEVGSWKGLSTSIIARFAGSVICVDTWMAATSTPTMLEEANKRDVFAVFRQNMIQMRLWDRIRPVVMKSLDAAQIIKPQSVDFLFIDADHSYPAVRNDILAWMPMVKPGGILCGHDCDILWKNASQDMRDGIETLKGSDFIQNAIEPGRGIHPGVTLAIHEIFDDNVTVEEGSCIWWTKL